MDYSRNEQQPHVVAGRPIILWCMVSGYPSPTVRWIKDGYPVSVNKNSDIRLIENGQGLYNLINFKCKNYNELF